MVVGTIGGRWNHRWPGRELVNLITGWQGEPPQCELADLLERSGIS